MNPGRGRTAANGEEPTEDPAVSLWPLRGGEEVLVVTRSGRLQVRVREEMQQLRVSGSTENRANTGKGMHGLDLPFDAVTGVHANGTSVVLLIQPPNGHPRRIVEVPCDRADGAGGAEAIARELSVVLSAHVQVQK
jgi:hypothetical protein